MAFHAGQKTTASSIITKLTQEQPFTILLAQMQSGKTGTYLFMAFEMIRQGIIDRAIIICGSSDTSLREQANKAMREDKEKYLEEIDPDGDLPRRITDKFNNIEVAFSQDLKNVVPVTINTLVIHDESHLAQSKDNLPFKNFYEKNHLDGSLYGDFSLLRENRNYILGVSATPFSEIVANRKVQLKEWTTEEFNLLKNIPLNEKNFHPMKAGEDYIGVSQFLKSKSIHFKAKTIKQGDCGHIIGVLHKGKEKYAKKYIVIRTQCAEKDKEMMMALASSCGYGYKSVFGGDGGDLSFMEEPPFVTTIIHICGRFRMGQVVPKGHIGMVYEQSKSPNADTILQGLLGRMCGYSSQGAHTNVDIFVSKEAESLVKKYDEAWSNDNMDCLAEVTKAMNLGGVKRRNGGMIVVDKEGVKHIKTVPVKFNLRQIERDFGEMDVGVRKLLPNDILNLFEDYPELIASNPDKEEILGILRRGVKYVHRHSAHKVTSSSMKKFNVLESAFDESKRENIGPYAQKCRERTTSVFEETPLSVYGSDSEENCYLMGYVRYNPSKHPPEFTEIASIDPKCNYVPGTATLEDDTILEGVNGGQIITFSLDTSDNPDILLRELSSAIERTIPEYPTYVQSAEKSINSLHDKSSVSYEGIRLLKSVYGEEKIENMKQALESKYSIKLKITKCRGRQPKEHYKFASISW